MSLLDTRFNTYIFALTCLNERSASPIGYKTPYTQLVVHVCLSYISFQKYIPLISCEWVHKFFFLIYPGD